MKTQTPFWQFIKEDVLGTENRFMAMSWGVAVIAILALGFYLNKETMSFLGVAESRESQVNFEYPVEVQNIYVFPGQQVKKGDLLVEVSQSEILRRQTEVTSLLQKLEAELQVRQQMSSVFRGTNDKSISTDPLKVEIENLRKELRILEQKKKSHFVFSEVDGVVGSVNYKKGEKVPSFTAIVSVSSEHPTYIHGFIHESLHARIEVGQKLKIKSVAGSTESEGHVVSVASRITPIPDRLLKFLGAITWGREVIIELPAQNNFLLSEKVQIQPVWARIGWTSALAKSEPTESPAKLQYLIGDIQLPMAVEDQVVFEPSGLIYLSDLHKYLVVSDDDHRLFLMDSDGRISDQVLNIDGAPDIEDIESISGDSQSILILASQSRTKHGKLKNERELLIQVERKGFKLQHIASLQLRPLLLQAMSDSQDEELRGLAQLIQSAPNKNADLEIEGHVILNDELYLGLKKPLGSNQEALVLKVSNFANLMSRKVLSSRDLSIWKKFDLRSAEVPKEQSITDMIMVDSQTLYFSTVCRGQTCSALWRLDMQNAQAQPQLLKVFDDSKLEGISFDPARNTFLGIFDNDGRQTQFVKATPFRP